MSQRGVRSRVPWGLLVCAVLGPTAACTAVAGIGGFGVDPCFDGCEAGTDAQVDQGTVHPDAGLDGAAEAGSEAGGDAGCDCPNGTQLINGVCAETASNPPSAVCTTPLQLPDCAIKVSVRVCDGDPPFTITEPTCIGDAAATRPTGFVRLGTSPSASGKWNVAIHAAYSTARPTNSCMEGGKPCRADGTSTSTITATGFPSGDVIAVGKRDDVVMCQDIEVEVVPN